MVIKIKYSYDGSKFYGMQRQKDKITVQGEIERVLFEVFSEKINLISSGRTDRGVHALNQVSNFEIKSPIPLETIKYQLNKHLYGKLKINEIDYATTHFNSRYSAIKRTYEYRFKLLKDISPFEANYISGINLKHIDLDKINKNLLLFIGTHDFTQYSKKDKALKNPLRQIYSAKCKYENEIYIATIQGNSFLKSMIRLIMASCIFENPEQIKNRLDLKDPNLPKKILSPYGLYLKEVIYDEN